MPRVFLCLLRLFYFPLTFFLPSAASSPRDAFGRRKTFLNTSFLTTGNCRPRICDKLNLCIFFFHLSFRRENRCSAKIWKKMVVLRTKKWKERKKKNRLADYLFPLPRCGFRCARHLPEIANESNNADNNVINRCFWIAREFYEQTLLHTLSISSRLPPPTPPTGRHLSYWQGEDPLHFIFTSEESLCFPDQTVAAKRNGKKKPKKLVQWVEKKSTKSIVCFWLI